MAQDDSAPTGPDLRAGVPVGDVPEGGMLAGHVEGEAVLLARLADGFHAVDAVCTHYGAPLVGGVIVGDQLRCPWHHACFSLTSGAALKAPALAPLGCWRVELADGRVRVGERQPAPTPAQPARTPDAPRKIVIVGAGAAGFAAAQRLRELGYDGTLTLLGGDAAAPYDRPNLSKDYLAGSAPEEWLPLRDDEFYASQKIDLRTGCEVKALDVQAREVRTAAGDRFDYDRLLLATGAAPRALRLPGAEASNLLVLRTLADCRAIIARCAGAKSVALLGAGFIGMEAAAALRQRGLAVHVVAPDAVPLQRVLGDELGRHLQQLHERHGVQFHLDTQAERIEGGALRLANGMRIAADVVLAGIGVTPDTALAEAAGLAVDNGILVDERLQASIAGHYAAGDVARYPWRGGRARVEHWVHAQRQGQAAAANMLGANQAYDEVPFFWTHQHEIELRYCGHGAGWDEVRIDGDLAAQDFTARYYKAGKLIAAASAGRDRENLLIEEELRGRMALA